MSPAEIDALMLSLRVAFWSTLWSLPLAMFVAWVLARRQFIGKTLVDALVHMPLVMPPVVMGFLLLMFLGRKGWIGAPLYDWFGVTIAFTWKGAAVASAVMAFPLMVRAIRLSLESMDQGLETAAQTLGAGPVRVFTSITLPLIFPGILTGLVLAFARSLGEFGATITFVSNIPGETRTLPLAVFSLLQTPGGDAAAIRLVAMSAAVAFLALVLSEWTAQRITKRLKGSA